jgi:hypothetical protein
MAWVAVGSAAIGAIGSSVAAGAQRDAAGRAADAQRYAIDKQTELNAPYREAGLTGQNKLMELLGLSGNQNSSDYGRYSRDFGMSDFQQDPGYSFRLNEGLKALDRSAASRGGLLSGATLRGVQDYGQNSASQEYQNAFNRYQTNRSNQLTPLMQLAGSGQNAANNLGSAYQGFGNNMSNLEQGVGNVNAAGIMGGANAVNSGISQYMNYQQGNELVNALKGYGNQSVPSGAAPSRNFYYDSDVSGGGNLYSSGYPDSSLTPGQFTNMLNPFKRMGL